MAKWKLEELEHKEHNGQFMTHLVLNCTDLGEIEEVSLQEHIDNFPYLSGRVKADGISYSICHKLSAMLWHMACTPYFHDDEYCAFLPEDQIIELTRNGNVIKLTKEKLKAYVGIKKINIRITDLRLIVLGLYVLRYKEVKLEHVPSRQEALDFLCHYGAYHAFSYFKPIHELDPYDVMNNMFFDWFPEKLQEKLEAEKKYPYEYEKNIDIAGTFAIKNRAEVFANLKPCDKCSLIREPDNHYDPNAILVVSPQWGKLGYVPKEDAKNFAPIIDNEACMNGTVYSIDPKHGKIQISVSRRKQFPIDEITSIHFERNKFPGIQHTYDLSFRTHMLIFRNCYPFERQPRQSKYELKIDAAIWDKFAMPLLKRCNFFAWCCNFENPCIQDGKNWRMTIRCGKKKQIKLEGLNAYPEEWEFWEKFLDDCLDMKHPKGCGRFYTLQQSLTVT